MNVPWSLDSNLWGVPMKRLVVGIAAVTGMMLGLVGAPASADIPLPPDNAVTVFNVKTTCTMPRGASYYTVSSSPKIYWGLAPKRKGLTVGHYMRVKTQIMTPAGYNGTMWKALATKTEKTQTYYLPAKGLPVTFQVPVTYNAGGGTLDYYTRVTVRVIRNVKPGLDTTAWKGEYWEQNSALCTGFGAR